MSILNRDASKAELRAAVAELEAKIARALECASDDYAGNEGGGSPGAYIVADAVRAALVAVPPETPEEGL